MKPVTQGHTDLPSGILARELGDNMPMDLENITAHLVVLAYRVASYASANLMDDAALLALMFC